MEKSKAESIPSRLKAAWNAHDMKEFENLFDPEATFVGRFGTYWRGRDKIVAGHKEIHETIYRDSVLDVDVPDLDVIGDDVVILSFYTRLTTGKAHPAGSHSLDTLVQAVAFRFENRWRIRAFANVEVTNPRSGRGFTPSSGM